MLQNDFALQVVETLKEDSDVVGLAVSGSWLSNELDEFSDLDLILVSREKIAGNKDLMITYAGRFGKLLSAFTGEHVGEPRLLICLYDDPLIHVDIKFLLPEEFASRAENPHILYDPEKELENRLTHEEAIWPFAGYQWMEDRFWVWIHYATTKIGRGEYFEALEFLSFLRVNVLSPLLLIKNNKLPKGVRKVEKNLIKEDLEMLKETVAAYDPESILTSMFRCISLYQKLRSELYPEAVILRKEAENKTIEYLQITGGRITN